jgi:TolB-like protein
MYEIDNPDACFRMVPEPTDAPTRRRVVLVLADAKAYSLAMERDQAGTWRRVTRALGLFARLAETYGGGLVDQAGDSILAWFPDPEPALRFAVEVQRELRGEAVWSGEAGPLEFRIGVHAGEVLEERGRVFGHAINVTQRIEALAPVGGICVSEAVQAELPAEPGVRLRSLGRPALKNIAERLELFAVEAEGLSLPPVALGLPDLEEPAAPANEASVAVLPLENLSGDPADEHLCRGLTTDLIGDLTRFRDLLVIAPHSVLQFQRATVPREQVARQLGVRYLVAGTLQHVASRLRLRVQLLEVERGQVLWSEGYLGELSELFAIQEDITGAVAQRLAIQITAAELRRLQRLRSPDLDAYGMVLRGQDLSHRYRRDSTLHARHLFELAARTDPDYGRPYAGMSRTFNLAWRYRWAEQPEACLDRAIELAAEALERDHLDARGYSELGFAHLYRKEHEASLDAYARAVELNPNDADILAEYADALCYVDQAERALELLNRALRLNPYYPDWYLWYLADVYNNLDRPEDVIATVRRMRNPSEGRRLLAANYAHLGMMTEARAEAREVLRLHPNFTIADWAQRPPYQGRERLERFIEGLRRAGLPER